MQNGKKLSLKRETLRTLDTNQLQQLDGVVGGTTATTTIGTTSLLTATIIEATAE